GSITSDHWVMADRQRLQQVLLNLLSNAVKYNREGGWVGVSITEAAPKRIHLVVTDTGVGIAPDMMARLFTPFHRLGADLRGVEGTGLGLTLSEDLVEAMQGTLRAESEVGRGMTFTVELPGVSRPDSEPSAPESLGTAATARVVPTAILYIEDNLA